MVKPQDYYSRLYNPADVIYARSFVYGLRYVPLQNNETAVLAKLRIGSSFPYVYLGSSRFLDNNNLNVDIVDSIAVTASVASVNGRHVLIAKELWRGDQHLVLLDDQGRPRWRNNK